MSENLNGAEQATNTTSTIREKNTWRDYATLLLNPLKGREKASLLFGYVMLAGTVYAIQQHVDPNFIMWSGGCAAIALGQRLGNNLKPGWGRVISKDVSALGYVPAIWGGIQVFREGDVHAYKHLALAGAFSVAVTSLCVGVIAAAVYLSPKQPPKPKPLNFG